MAWFKVDDGLHASTKARRAGEAMALWVMGGSWCADQLTDGWIPEDMAEALAPKNWKKWAAKLVAVKLWVAEERDGERGWRYHDWDVYQPTRAHVLTERKAAAERQQRARERARESRRNGRVSHGVTDAVTSPVSNGPPDPTRPDPTTNGTTAAVHSPSEAREPGSAGPAEQILAGWLANCPKQPPSRVVNDVGRQVAALLAEGIDRTDVSDGLRVWQGRGVHPSVLPSIVHQVMNTPPPAAPSNVVALRADPRPSTTDQRVSAALEAGRRVQAKLDQRAADGLA